MAPLTGTPPQVASHYSSEALETDKYQSRGDRSRSRSAAHWVAGEPGFVAVFGQMPRPERLEKEQREPDHDR
jgi:hypothetical protein